MNQVASQLQGQTKASWLPSSGILQRKCACGGTPGPMGECEACRKKREAATLQRTGLYPGPVHSAPPIVHDVLHSPGQPLDPATRAFMEPRFGHDFSQVRVHTDAKATQSARAVNALAYTVGRDIVFRSDSYRPATAQGDGLIAHELVHVLQQRGSPPTQTETLGIDPPYSHAEGEATTMARQVLRQSKGQPSCNLALRVSRAPWAVNREPAFAPGCNEYDRCKVVEPLRAANLLVDRALAELPPVASGAVTRGRIVDLVNVHFHDPSNVAPRATTVLNNFRAIKAELNATIRFICHPPLQDCTTTEGRVGAFTGDQPGGDIGLCDAYHSADCAEQARMLIHEVCHHVPATRIDHAYVQEASYMALTPDRASENPDTYAQFAKTVFLGTPSCKDCSSEIQLRPGQY